MKGPFFVCRLLAYVSRAVPHENGRFHIRESNKKKRNHCPDERINQTNSKINPPRKSASETRNSRCRASSRHGRSTDLKLLENMCMRQKRKYNKVSQTGLSPNSSNIALNDTKMYFLETKATNYMKDIQKQSGGNQKLPSSASSRYCTITK